MFTMFIYGVITAVLFFVLKFLINWIIGYIYAAQEESWIGISILILMLAVFASCSKEEVFEDVCGSCSVSFDIPFEQDSNGYYIADLNFNSAGAARFNIDTYASVTESYTYSIFSGNIDIEEFENTQVVQNSRLDHNDQGFTRRVVGPVLSKFVGDTLIVNVETYWEGNASWEVSKNTLKFILK